MTNAKQDFFQRNSAKIPFISVTLTLVVLVAGLTTSTINLITANKLDPLKNQIESLKGDVLAIKQDHIIIKENVEKRFDNLEQGQNNLLIYFGLKTP